MVLIDQFDAGNLGFGLMGLTWRPTQTPDEVAFPLLRKAIELGCIFWNSGEFYGMPEPTLNLQLLNRYFAKYPDDRQKVFISVKGCLDSTMKPDGSAEGVRKSVENSVKVLGGYIDLFQAARVDKSVAISETMGAFNELIKEGKIKSIGLSECSAATIREAAKYAKIAAVEQEYSLWSTEIEDNGIAAACAELKIPIVAYSPLGRGFLTGQIKQKSDIPEGDIRHRFDRFSEENFPKNLKLVEQLNKIASEKHVEGSQLAVAWVLAQQERLGTSVLPIPGCTSIPRLEENVGGRNVVLSQEELSSIQKILKSVTVEGGRYNKHVEGMLYG